MFEVVVGIDFGSWGTGYAYSFKNPSNIELGRFPWSKYFNKSSNRNNFRF